MIFKQLNILDSLLFPELCFLIVVTCASYKYWWFTVGYHKYILHLWWSICWFGEDDFREVIPFFCAGCQTEIFTIVGFSLNVSSNYLHSFSRRQDSSIGFGAPVRTNMRTGGTTNAVVTSSLLESVRIHPIWLPNFLIFILIAFCVYIFWAMHIPFII